MMEKVKKNTIIVDPDYRNWNVCDIREYTPDDDDALAAGRVKAHELPLSGEWQEERDYEWGDQRVVCFARWNKTTGTVQVVKAHGYDEDLRLDSLGNLWELRWNSTADKWERRLIG